MGKHDHDLVIIGAGPGGYRAAFMAADLGIKVTLIDPEKNPGGVCLYRGCIPTKALLHISKIIKDAGNAHEMGITFKNPDINQQKVINWKDKVVKKLTGGLGQLNKARKTNYIQGLARFIDNHTLELTDAQGGKKKTTFQKAIIATGATPLSLPGIERNNPDILHAEQALELKEIPKSMLIIGAGYIGLEMATIYNSLGTKVSIAELTDQFMPGMDTDLVNEFLKTNKGNFTDTFLKTKVESINKTDNGLEVEFRDEKNKSFTKIYEKVLVSIGQRPNTKDIELDNTEIETDEKGFIKVNKYQQTNQPNIYAIGDVCGGPLLAHKASYEGRVAAEHIAGRKVENDAKVIPAVIYTEPEIATCGLSEQEATKQNIDYKKVKFPWTALGRAVAMNEKTGFTKLLIDKKSERIIGAGIVGKNAGDIITELAVAIEMAATAEDIALTIHPHPTLSESIMEAAEMFYGHSAHMHTK